MPKINQSESALHDWVHTLTFQQQALLMTGMRGPDGCNKHNPPKAIVRFLRGAICKPAGNWDGKNNNDFMWGDYSVFKIQAKSFFDDPDGFPHHFIMHLVHCAEVIGLKHPVMEVADHWAQFYFDACKAFHMTPETVTEMDNRLNDFGLSPASHPAPTLIVGEREERKYPIGGYGPGNYWNKCVTCKAQFMGDKRAVQCEPCATKMIEEAGGKDYAYIHMKLPNGAAATVSPNASPELLNALTKMIDLAKDVPPAPTEQALPEGVDEADYYAISKLNDWHLKQLRECQAELKAANIKIKELQEWHDSHL